MVGTRGRGLGSALVLRAVALAPMVALIVAAALDRGPGGSVRATLFPAALAALDDHVWLCARNSLAVAAAVTFVSRVVGVALARIAVRWRFWGRRPLVALTASSAVIPPAFVAVGLRGWAQTGAIDRAWAAGWLEPLAWFWSGLVFGIPLVAFAAASALARVDAPAEDAARLAGAGRRRIWRQIVWPVVRPGVARALGLVFTLTLIEPGAPLVLGLRRTLGFQIAASALEGRPGSFTRAAVLTLAAVLASGLGRLLIGWWGGHDFGDRTDVETVNPRVESAPPGRALASVLALALASALAWFPIGGLVAASVSGGSDSWGAMARDPLLRQYLRNSAILGTGAVALGVVLARWIARCAPSRRPGPRLAPLALAVAFLAIPAGLRMAAEGLRTSVDRPGAVGVVGALTDLLDPGRIPWVALIVATSIGVLPLLIGSAIERREGLRPVRIDAALTLGVSRRRARRRIAGRRLGVSPGAALLALALAATEVAPALLLAPTAETRPIGPAVLVLVDEPGGGARRASALAVLGIALNLAALAVAARGRTIAEPHRPR